MQWRGHIKQEDFLYLTMEKEIVTYHERFISTNDLSIDSYFLSFALFFFCLNMLSNIKDSFLFNFAGQLTDLVGRKTHFDNFSLKL